MKKIVSTILVLGTILSAKPTLTADVNVLYDAYTFGYEGSKKNKNPLFMKAYCKGAYLGGIHQTFYININQILNSCYLGGMHKIKDIAKFEKNKFNSFINK